MARRISQESRWYLPVALVALACHGQVLGTQQSGPGVGSSSAGTASNPGEHGLPPASSACAEQGLEPGPSPIRRLTRAEYDNTVRDLLSDTTAPASLFTQEEVALGFTNNADAQTVSDLLGEQYEAAATSLALTATSNLPGLLGCDPALTDQDSCARSFILAFGLKAYRRPLAAEEVERLFALYSGSKASYDFATAVRFVLAAMLQSPHFLYRFETGADQTPGSVTRLGGYESASRLSYLLWSSMPDAELFAAAAAGQLDTAAGVAEQARRMLADPRANQAVASFFSQWLDLDKLAKVGKDASLFPRFTPDVRRLLRQETELFVSDAVFGGGNWEALLRGTSSFMNKDLAAYYGLSGPQGDAFERVSLNPSRYSGLLTQAGLLASYANINQTSPIVRGLFVRERLLCSPPPPPPANVDVTPPALDPSLTTRERFAAHRMDPACAGCHNLMDPIGLGFEHFDAAGIWRDEDAGKPIDASGEIVGSQDSDGVFNGVVELATKLATSQEVRACLVRQWFRFSYGRGETAADECTLQALDAAFDASRGDMKELLVTLTQTDAFLYRRSEKEGAP